MKGLGMAKNAVGNFTKESVEAYKKHNVALTQLEQVMRNTMGAGKFQVNEIVDFTGAQAKKGVVGRDVQLAGSKELGTYLKHSDSLKSLIPVMNDVLAHQYGLNATQESAQSIAQMFGKVLDGQTNALSRNGYTFTEAQEQILKYGTESERVAVLADVVSQSVGGVNEALAATPEGKAKQIAIEYEEVNLRAGELLTKLQGDASTTFKKFTVTLYENRQMVAGIAKTTGTAAAAALSYMAVVKSGITLVKLKTAAITAKTFMVNLFTGKIKLATAAQAAFNAVSKMNPIGLVTGAITAAATAWALFSKRGNEAADMLKKAGDYAKDYYTREKKYLDDVFEKMQKTNAGSKERNKLVDELKARYPGLNSELERELRTTGDINAAKEKLIGLIKQEAVAKGFKKLYEEKAEAVAKAEIESYAEEQANEIIRKNNAKIAWEAANTVAVGDAGIGGVASSAWSLKSESNKAKKKLEKANEELQKVDNLLKTKEKELLYSLAGGTGNGRTEEYGTGASGTDDKKTSTVSDAITGGGRSMKNITVNVDKLIGENTNIFQSSNDDPASAEVFMDKLKNALQVALNDVNYS
jgi:hypothetical protein